MKIIDETFLFYGYVSVLLLDYVGTYLPPLLLLLLLVPTYLPPLLLVMLLVPTYHPCWW